jgi:hypothetical protein
VKRVQTPYPTVLLHIALFNENSTRFGGRFHFRRISDVGDTFVLELPQWMRRIIMGGMGVSYVLDPWSSYLVEGESEL